uniref:Uncharacterized protein n=1 Tax=Ditylenchus dipsaci TaxID=166011 RepID=A0A915DXR8_9BILA
MDMTTRCFIPCEILREVFYFIPDAYVGQLWACSSTIFFLLEPRLKIKNQQAEDRIRMLARKVDRLVNVIVQDYFRNCQTSNDTQLTPARLEVLMQKTEASEEYITGYWGELLSSATV